jgi:hypothetical protein
MAEQTFKSPGFFDQEIDLSGGKTTATGIPAGVVGTSQKGPAFVPVTVGSFADFENKFGTLDPKRFGPYAVQKWLDNRTACTYVRVLGAGSNETATDISNSKTSGIVANAGFKISGTLSTDASLNINSSNGTVQFICAIHNAATNEVNGLPVFSDNSSVVNPNAVNLVRGVVLLATGTRMFSLNHDAFAGGQLVLGTSYSTAKVGSIGGSSLTDQKYFKIVLSSSAGKSWGYDESIAGFRILSASLDPNDGSYIGKVLNTDPLKFESEQHLLYLDYAVEHDLAPVISDTVATVAIMSGTSSTSATSGLSTTAFESLFGRFDTRYTTPKTTSFISQPFGKTEFDLFHFETIDDGAYANDKFKVSIAGLKASTNDKQPFGSFEVQIRSFDDSDGNSSIVERYPDCSLDPKSSRYIARLIGDKKVRFDFDQEDPDERRLVVTGKYPNVSTRVRIVMNEQVENGQVPKNCLPFGFRGIPVLKTSDSLTDTYNRALTYDGKTYGDVLSRRLYSNSSTANDANVLALSSSIVPPLPYRVKVTRGAISTNPTFLGHPGNDERVDGRLYWGVKTEPVPVDITTDSVLGTTNSVLNSNIGAGINQLVRTYTKFQGIEKLDTLVTGSAADVFNNNKFTLSRVALYNTASALSDVTTSVTGTASEHILEAAYVRDAIPNSTTYTVNDGVRSNRITLASLISTSSALFNQFTPFAKFTNIFYGGFDGLNILDEDQFYFKDRSLSSDTGGKNTTSPNIGLSTNPAGSGRRNNNVYSLQKAIDVITNPTTTKINILAIPGVRDAYVTDYAAAANKNYGLALYIMDPPEFDKDSTRLYDDSTGRSDVSKTIAQFETRVIDNGYSATYFPDVRINDNVNNRVVEVPPSIAALGALGFNDKNQQVWFAPAGFNRASLDFVTNVENRLSAADRDALYSARINPIATFPRAGFVIFGQKTLQVAQSALDKINVRRMLLDVKRRISNIAKNLAFENNNSTTRSRFSSLANQELSYVQAGKGIERFEVICDETNNTDAEIEQNRMRALIKVVPTRTIEYIAIDFVVTNSGVSFE